VSGYNIDIEKATEDNDYFRKVLHTAEHMQLVLMTLQVGEEIGQEMHPDVDQFFRVEHGQADAILESEIHKLVDGSVLIIPAGTEHNVVNTSPNEPLRLYTIYSPPNHPDGTINKTKAEAEEYERIHHGH
jgi:mannose-6-phosphate isomerase-like protein (cupin superfamily)